MDRTNTPYLPERVEGLAEVATNLSWSWNDRARTLFARIDPTLWQITKHNPIRLLRRVNPRRLTECARDPEFLALYDQVVAESRRESSPEGTWFAKTYPDVGRDRPVAYFCAEFGLHDSLPIYSGGLGILAGDHCKSASDLGVPFVGIGLFYDKGYFDQRVRADGMQEDANEEFDVGDLPLERLYGPNRSRTLAKVRTFGRDIHLGAWRVRVGRVGVILLDARLDENHPEDRDLTGKLYSGGPNTRLRQEWILGVGGVRVLRALGINPGVWHANEGHAAFMIVERLREYALAGVPYDESVRRVRGAGVFTTHTPVPAGHDTFPADQVEQCGGPLWDEMKISRETYFNIGRHPDGYAGQFHMTVAAMRLSARVNGVAKRHGEVTREIWQSLWPDRDVTRVPVGHVTNGVHLATWMSARLMRLLDRQLGADWLQRRDEPGLWEGVLEVDDAQLWALHQELKHRLLTYLREEARRRWSRAWPDASQVSGAGAMLDPNVLTIGFARRFATYKRAALLFQDFERVRAMLTNPDRPVQILFAGKAHPADGPGKKVLQTVYQLARDARLEGRVAFVEDYEMNLARRLVKGVDLWMNMPRVPLEASGTSGMKAALNGVPQISTLDGWWPEAYNGLNGWAIPTAPADVDADAHDAKSLLELLETQVVPQYYTRDGRGVPTGWTATMKQAMRVALDFFTTHRMVQQYAQEYYVPAIRASGDGAAALADDPPTA